MSTSTNDKPRYIPFFFTHIPKNEHHEDAHLCKFRKINPDGTEERVLKVLYNFRRPFWVTKPIYRKHKQKREFEELSKVKTYYSTQSDLINDAAKALGRVGYRRNNKRDIENNPYLYGIDVNSVAFLKKMFMDKVNNEIREAAVAGLDTEANPDTDELYINSVVFEEKVFVCVLKDFVKNEKNPEEKIMKLAKKHIPEEDFKKMDIEIRIVENEFQVMKQPIDKLHEWKPDFLVIWNVLYDMGIFQKVCERNGYPIELIFKDPDLPDELAIFNIKKGRTTKKMASGKETPVPIQQRWNVVTTSASFYIADGMTVYNFVRQGEKLVPGGYGIDNLMKRTINQGKLKIIENDLMGKEWHLFMQEQHPIEYVVYNIWDTYGMMKFVATTKDFSISISALSDMSSFDIFHSGPRKNVDGLLFYALENDKRVLMTRGNEPMEPEISTKKWIVTLDPSYLTDRFADFSAIEENTE